MPRVDSTTESGETRLARAVKECMFGEAQDQRYEKGASHDSGVQVQV